MTEKHRGYHAGDCPSRAITWAALATFVAAIVGGGIVASVVVWQAAGAMAAGSNSALAGIAAAVVLAVAVAAAAAGGLVARAATEPWRRLAERAESVAERTPGSAPVSSADPVSRIDSALEVIDARLRATRRDFSTERGTLAAVLDGMADGVVVIGPDGKVAVANPAAVRILGFADDVTSLAGRSFIEALRDHELIELVQERLAGDGQATPTRAVSGSGSRQPAGDEPVFLEVGLPRRYLRVQVAQLGESRGLVVLQDLTEIRRAETVRREFVANVSHELRTPLASLKALVETLQDGALEDPTVSRDFLGRMDVEIDGLTQLVRELLDLSRIEAGRLTMNRSSESAATLIERAASRLQAQADRAGLTLVVEAAPDLPPIHVDAERLVQALINLIHNAIKFTPPGGLVRVSATGGRRRADNTFELLAVGEPGPSPTHAILSVTDTGVGIAPDDLPRIFERFYKADKARTGGGTGLGLAIVKHVVEAHGGRVWAESLPGAGATFRLAIPAASQVPGRG